MKSKIIFLVFLSAIAMTLIGQTETREYLAVNVFNMYNMIFKSFE